MPFSKPKTAPLRSGPEPTLGSPKAARPLKPPHLPSAFSPKRSPGASPELAQLPTQALSDAVVPAVHNWWVAANDALTAEHTYMPCEFTVDAPFNCGTICDGNYASKPELDVIAPGKSLQSNCESKTRCRYNIPSDASE